MPQIDKTCQQPAASMLTSTALPLRHPLTMHHVVEPDATGAPPVSRAARGPVFWLALRACWMRIWMRLRVDERTAYLARASSHTDLEHRMRQWAEQEGGPQRWFF